MGLQALSIILYAALQTAQPCEKVFVDTALSANPLLKASERPYLEEFSKAACATSNPDILWLLGLQETNFRFLIMRENKGKTFKITEGTAVITALKKLKKMSQSKNPPKMNVDIGVMQFNWHWHGDAFNNDPLLALSPKRQVDYFVEKFSREIYRTCDDNWVGCYHNQSNDALTASYQKDITKKTLRLANNVINLIKDFRAPLNGEQLDALPSIVPEEFYKTFAYTRSFPRPQKVLFDRTLKAIASK